MKKCSMILKRVRSAGLALVGAAMIAIATPQASAQQMSFSMGGDSGDWTAQISKSSLKSYGKILKLDETQFEAVEALYDSYLTQHQAGQKEMQDAIADVQAKFNETKDFTVWQKDFPKKMQELGDRMEKFETAFFDDFKVLLTKEQEDRFAGVERHRRRDKNLRFGFIAGESVDLVKVVDRAGIDADQHPPVREALDGYEGEMDQALAKKERDAKAAAKEMQEFEGGFDPKMMAKAEEMMKNMRAVGKQQRTLNKDYAGKIQRGLPEAEAAKFEVEFRKAMFPRVYRESHVSKSLDAALKLDDLEGSQRDTLKAVKEQYERELGSANDKWAQAVEDRDDKIGDDMMSMAQMFMPNKDEKGPLADAKKARKDLDDRTRERLLAALNPAQKDKLPKAPAKHETAGGDGPIEIEVNGGEFTAGDAEGAVEVKMMVAPGGGG